VNLRYICFAYRTQRSLQCVVATYHTFGSLHWLYPIPSPKSESTIFFICSFVIRGKSGWECLLWKELSSVILSTAQSGLWVFTSIENLQPWTGHTNEYCTRLSSFLLQCDNISFSYSSLTGFALRARKYNFPNPAITNCPLNSLILKETPQPALFTKEGWDVEG